jgi:hypothetical protein
MGVRSVVVDAKFRVEAGRHGRHAPPTAPKHERDISASLIDRVVCM